MKGLKWQKHLLLRTLVTPLALDPSLSVSDFFLVRGNPRKDWVLGDGVGWQGLKNLCRLTSPWFCPRQFPMRNVVDSCRLDPDRGRRLQFEQERNLEWVYHWMTMCKDPMLLYNIPIRPTTFSTKKMRWAKFSDLRTHELLVCINRFSSWEIDIKSINNQPTIDSDTYNGQTSKCGRHDQIQTQLVFFSLKAGQRL